jgi:putative Mg2+ transporter-C (MgtC) family protein
MLVAMDVYEGSDAEARVMYGIITGMGFIGGGAIVKQSGRAIGTANAAGIWLTGAIGLSVAYSRYEIALVLSIIGFLIFQFGSYLKKQDA